MAAASISGVPPISLVDSMIQIVHVMLQVGNIRHNMLLTTCNMTYILNFVMSESQKINSRFSERAAWELSWKL